MHSPFDGSHTGENKCLKFKEIFHSLNISEDRIHVIVSDNVPNMLKAMRDAVLPHLGCFAYTLQLVVKDGVLVQRAVIDMIATSKKIIGHFKHSTIGCSCFKDIQSNLGLPQHRLLQHEPTRWN